MSVIQSYCCKDSDYCLNYNALRDDFVSVGQGRSDLILVNPSHDRYMDTSAESITEIIHSNAVTPLWE